MTDEGQFFMASHSYSNLEYKFKKKHDKRRKYNIISGFIFSFRLQTLYFQKQSIFILILSMYQTTIN